MSDIKVDFLPGQAEVFVDTHRFRVLDCGRRWGKSFLAARILVLAAIEHPKRTYWSLAPTAEQTRVIYEEVLSMISDPAVAQFVDRTYSGASVYVKFRNGSRIFFKSGDNPLTLRGATLHGAVLDEAAFMKKDVWTRVVRPMLMTTGGWAVIISTPWGKNWFYDMWKRGESDEFPQYISFHYSSYDNPMLSDEEIQDLTAEMDDTEYRQEILAEFMDGGGLVFRDFMQVTVGVPLPGPEPGHQYIIGADIAKERDYTVLSIFDADTGDMVSMTRFNRLDWVYVKQSIGEASLWWNGAMIVLDKTGVGGPVYDDLVMAGLPVVGYKITTTTKQELVKLLKIAIEERRITLLNDSELIKEFEQFTFKQLPSSIIQYSAPEGKHDDIVISVGLAVFGMHGGVPLTVGSIEPSPYDTNYDTEDVRADYDELDLSAWDEEEPEQEEEEDEDVRTTSPRLASMGA